MPRPLPLWLLPDTVMPFSSIVTGADSRTFRIRPSASHGPTRMMLCSARSAAFALASGDSRQITVVPPLPAL